MVSRYLGSLVLLVISALGLIGVRAMEEKLFYDPFLSYYRGAFHLMPAPNYLFGKLVWSHFFRFGLNLFFSCLVVYALFQDKKKVKISAFVMSFFFLLSLLLYLLVIASNHADSMVAFYLRRFVLQPILLLLLLPIFYVISVQQKQNKP